MTRGIAEIHADLIQAAAAIDELATQRREATTTPEDLVWAALTLANDAATCTSILAGRPVRVQNLDTTQLHHALRGATPPHDDGYLIVTKEMLHAIIEAGPLEDTWEDIPAHLRPNAREAPPPDNVVPISSQPPRTKVPRVWIPR